MRIEDSQVNELAQLPLISHPGASCQPLLGYDWEWAKIIKLYQIFFSTWPLLALTSHWMYFGFKGWFVHLHNEMYLQFWCLSFSFPCITTKLAPLSLLFIPSWDVHVLYYSVSICLLPFWLDFFILFFFPPQFVLSWEGTHYSYGYSAVPRIQQCIQVSVLLSLLNSYDFILPYWSACGNRICICASSLCKMVGWN